MRDTEIKIGTYETPFMGFTYPLSFNFIVCSICMLQYVVVVPLIIYVWVKFVKFPKSLS